ncbi:MAG: hypothetical protein RIT45_334, partial [Pseudomonadota bacterium]
MPRCIGHRRSRPSHHSRRPRAHPLAPRTAICPPALGAARRRGARRPARRGARRRRARALRPQRLPRRGPLLQFELRPLRAPRRRVYPAPLRLGARPSRWPPPEPGPARAEPAAGPCADLRRRLDARHERPRVPRVRFRITPENEKTVRQRRNRRQVLRLRWGRRCRPRCGVSRTSSPARRSRRRSTWPKGSGAPAGIGCTTCGSPTARC